LSSITNTEPNHAPNGAANPPDAIVWKTRSRSVGTSGRNHCGTGGHDRRNAHSRRTSASDDIAGSQCKAIYLERH